MATGGRQSVEGSDVFHDFACSLCEKKENHVEAVKRCQDCGENLCNECLTNHNMFKSMQGHILVNKDDIGKVGQAGGCFVPTVKCENHFGKDIELYCGDHDVVACATCIALEHRQCEDVKHIQQAVVDVKNKEESKQVEESIKHLLEQAVRLKQARQADLKRIQDGKKAVLHDVNSQIDAIHQRLGALKIECIAFIDDNAKVCTDTISQNIDTLEDTIHKLEVDNTRLRDVKCVGESELFIFVKQSKTYRGCLEKQLSSLENTVGTEQLEFNVDDSVLKCANKLETFVKKTPCLQASSDGTRNIRIKEDTKECLITDCFVLDNGNIVMTDEYNRRVKLFDQSYRLLHSCVSPGAATAICQDGDGGVALALYNIKAVQFATANKKLRLTRTFSVGEKCRGISYANRKLYVTCGGRTNKDEGPGQVRIYSITGELLHKIQTDDNGEKLFDFPMHIKCLSSGIGFVVADKGKGLIAINEHGKIIWLVQDYGLKFASGVCEIKHGQLLACSLRDCYIYQINTDGRMRVLLKHSEEVKKLRSISYDSHNENLMITSKKRDAVHVYSTTYV